MGWMLIACCSEEKRERLLASCKKSVIILAGKNANLSQVPKRRCILSLDHPSWLQKHSHSFIFIHHSVPRGFLTQKTAAHLMKGQVGLLLCLVPGPSSTEMTDAVKRSYSQQSVWKRSQISSSSNVSLHYFQATVLLPISLSPLWPLLRIRNGLLIQKNVKWQFFSEQIIPARHLPCLGRRNFQQRKEYRLLLMMPHSILNST